MRLIDADRLKRQVEGRSWRAKDKMVELIDNSPTIEAEPVKHGEWRDYPIADGCLQCSICGVLRIGGPSNFCPHCGAKMNTEEGETHETD